MMEVVVMADYSSGGDGGCDEGDNDDQMLWWLWQ